MQVVILAGGLATRLRPLTEETPKSLIEIQGKPFLQYQLDFLKRGGVTDIVLCVSYLGDRIESYFGNGARLGVNIKYSYEKERLLGTAGALRNAETLLDEQFFVMYGDSYLFLDFDVVVSYFQNFDKLALMMVYKNFDRYDASNVVVNNNLVSQYNKRHKTEGMVYIDYGVSLLRKEVLKLIPPNQVHSLEEFFTQLIRRKELLACEIDRRFYQIGSLEGLREFKKYISESERVTP